MKKTLFLFIILTKIVYSQNISITKSIEWDNNNRNIDNNVSSLYFKGVDYIFEENNAIPTYTVRVKIKADEEVDRVILTDMKFEQFSDEENKLIKSWEKKIRTVVPTNRIVTERNNKFIEISFIPVKEADNDNSYLKLTYFKVNIWLKRRTKNSQSNYISKNNSVLSSGKWIKIGIKNSGIYKLSYSELTEMGFQNLENIRVYGNSYGLLPENNSIYRPDDLLENAIELVDGNDGVFNKGDYILFYGVAPHIWKYNETGKRFYFKRQLYSDYSYYFITTDLGPGKKIINKEDVTQTPNTEVVSFNDFAIHELEDTNLLRSGKKWIGEQFYNLLDYTFQFNFPNRIENEPVLLNYSLVARSSREYPKSSFNITVNNQVDNVEINTVDLGTYVGRYAQESIGMLSYLVNGSEINVNLDFNPAASTSSGWLDYFILNVRRNLIFDNGQMFFRDANSVGTGNISRFTISNTNNQLKVWDVTFPDDVENITLEILGQNSVFVANSDTLHEYIAFDGSSFLSIENYEEIANQNLHGAEVCDMIIVAPPAFIDQANWIADFHKEHDGIKSFIAIPEDIYNEYSSGMPDVGAIRDFVRHMYFKSTDGTHKLKYLLLFGDGSYDNRSSFMKNTNYLLTYQSDNSFHISSSFVTDDFFGLLDDNEGGNFGNLDIGIGRIPVLQVSDAETIISKIENYHSASSFGDWRNMLCFIADDADENQPFHMSDANRYTNIIHEKYPAFNFDKIYLDAFPQESTPSGQRYPDVNKAINDRIRKGALLINYTGHGNPKVLTDEQVVTVSEINNWENINNLPVFVTATCEFSRYDDKNRVSAGEYIMLNPSGGAIAMLTTSRLVYAGSNDALNTEFYNHAFSLNSDGQYYRLGDIVRLTKVNTGSASSTNKRNFSLLGDPALQLAIPQLEVMTDSINLASIQYVNDSVIQDFDTLKALSKVKICGYISDNNGNSLTSFNGVLYPTIYDKARNITTLSNDGFAPLTYSIQKNIIYKGKATVKNGRFNFTFIVPRDISYNYGFGKISYYLTGNALDGSGYFDKISIGGSVDSVFADKKGPEINLYLNDDNFIYGGTTNNEPTILAVLSDSSGINTVGNGIGHDITAVLDNDENNLFVLNDYYEANLDSYQSGKVEYVMSKLENGNHNLKLKVWDIQNNPSEENIEFVVAESEDIALEHVFNYPNPFTTQTAFYFDHNQPNTDLNILIQVFTVSGKLVKTFNKTINTTGFRNEPIYWNGLDEYGDKIGRGVYIYRLKVRTPDGKIAEKYEKLVILK
ncbi:MAG: type IX secretion system sortase PorU [Chlorobi bacterium]|nr:type IX secretion system sortase PorU [Chlorobiota bacterium]